MSRVVVLQKGSKFAVYVNDELALECVKEENAQAIKDILDKDSKMEEQKSCL